MTEGAIDLEAWRKADIERTWNNIPEGWGVSSYKHREEGWTHISIEPVIIGNNKLKHPLSQFGLKLNVTKNDGTEFEECINLCVIEEFLKGLTGWVKFDPNAPTHQLFRPASDA